MATPELTGRSGDVARGPRFLTSVDHHNDRCDHHQFRRVDGVRMIWRPLGGRCTCAAMVVRHDTATDLLLVLDPSRPGDVVSQVDGLLEGAGGCDTFRRFVRDVVLAA